MKRKAQHLGLHANPSAKLGAEVTQDYSAAFIVALLTALQKHGMPANRVEAMGSAVAEKLGETAHFFCTPTAIFVALGAPPEQRTYLVEGDTGEIHLGKLGALDGIANDVAAGRSTVEQGLAALALIETQPGLAAFPRWIGNVLVSAASAFLLGGSHRDAAVACLSGSFISVLEELNPKVESLSRLTLPLAAFVSALLAYSAANLVRGVDVGVATIAGLIVLFPGLTFTTAMNEVAMGHLVSGTARLSKAFMAFLLLGSGAALGAQLGTQLFTVPRNFPDPDFAAWVPWAAEGVALAGILVLLAVAKRDIVWVVCSGALAFGLVQASSSLGPELTAGIGALVIGLCSNAVARFKERPAAIVSVPGILLLVPGTVGFRSVRSFWSDDVLTAVDMSFQVAAIALALVAGLLLATALLPPKKAL